MGKLHIITSIVVLLFAGAQGVFWNDLRISFNLTFSDDGFDQMPRTTKAALEQGFTLNSTTCEHNDEYFGFRYVDPEDDYVALLFDVKGTVAGVQLMLPEEMLMDEWKSTYRYEDEPKYMPTVINDQRVYLLSAYFVNPSRICTGGREECDLSTEGTGTGMYFGNGKRKFMELPRNRAAAIAKGWSNNGCVPGMGKHNYYMGDNWGDDRCKKIQVQPFFGIYNQKDQLHGIGFTLARAVPHKRFEIQTVGNIQAAQPKAAPCVLDMVGKSGISTLHVYLVSDPWQIKCPGWPTLAQLKKATDQKEHQDAEDNYKKNHPTTTTTTTTTTTITKKPIKLRGGPGLIGAGAPGSAGGQESPANPPSQGSIVKTATGEFEIPASLMDSIMRLEQKAEDKSRQQVADDLPPGESFEEIDLMNALSQYTYDKGTENTTGLEPYDIADAMKLYQQYGDSDEAETTTENDFD